MGLACFLRQEAGPPGRGFSGGCVPVAEATPGQAEDPQSFGGSALKVPENVAFEVGTGESQCSRAQGVQRGQHGHQLDTERIGPGVAACQGNTSKCAKKEKVPSQDCQNGKVLPLLGEVLEEAPS
ncbi:hypothetical protein P7K49_020644 [Saguinus oedipus]|uniref:Uncharacterized protein n=1 Tax=Saguinus oedipus TaxID=9490 RepID=A0ABQ9V0W3_SAGOE|nr:hypothetical protein P7K49_020644 [Saguinus oedipus]